MSIVVTEKPDSRQTTDGRDIELQYIITGTDDDAAAMAALKTHAPLTHNSMSRRKCRIDPVSIDTANPDKCIWDGVAPYEPSSYSPPEPMEVGESSYSFDTGGGTQHITQAIQTSGSYAPPGKTPPNFKGAIGVTHENVQGVDITVPVYNFCETHIKADSVVTPSYKAGIFLLTGKVNNASFKGLDAGECLFLGASGSKRGQEDWEITFRFAANPNRTGLTVGDITDIDKKGWEYMWVRYADAEDSAAKAIVKKPVAAYIEKVYEDGDFAQLGI